MTLIYIVDEFKTLWKLPKRKTGEIIMITLLISHTEI